MAKEETLSAAELPQAPQSSPSRLKRLIVISASAGAGAVIAIALIWFLLIWYASLADAPKPWNSKAITATFDKADVEKRDDLKSQSIVVYYTLNNLTDRDFTLPVRDQLKINGRLKSERSLTGGPGLIPGDLPLFIPAKERVSFSIHLAYPITMSFGEEPKTEEERRQRKRLIDNCLNDEFANLDGFVIFDPAQRYQINFPVGWR